MKGTCTKALSQNYSTFAYSVTNRVHLNTVLSPSIWSIITDICTIVERQTIERTDSRVASLDQCLRRPIDRFVAVLFAFQALQLFIKRLFFYSRAHSQRPKHYSTVHSCNKKNRLNTKNWEISSVRDRIKYILALHIRRLDIRMNPVNTCIWGIYTVLFIYIHKYVRIYCICKLLKLLFL